VDVYWNQKRDASRARHMLMQIAETMPNTRHAANAMHRLHEIDRALADEASGIVKVPSALRDTGPATETPDEPGETPHEEGAKSAGDAASDI
jgi:hypothetical protein